MNTYGRGAVGVLERLRDQKRDDGFSLIELIVVVLVIGIIAAIAVPVFLNAQDNARQSAVEDTANAGLTTATAAILEGSDAVEALGQVDAQNEDISLELLVGADSTNPDDLCVEATYSGTDNVAMAGVACDDVPAADATVGVYNNLTIFVSLTHLADTDYSMRVENLDAEEIVLDVNGTTDDRGHVQHRIVNSYQHPARVPFNGANYRVQVTVGEQSFDLSVPNSLSQQSETHPNEYYFGVVRWGWRNPDGFFHDNTGAPLEPFVE